MPSEKADEARGEPKRLPMDHEDALDEAAKRLYDTYLMRDPLAPAGVRDWLWAPKVRSRFLLAFRRTVQQMLETHAEDVLAASGRPASGGLPASPALAEEERPKIVCLCGSTRFWETFRDEGLRLTMAGEIVLSIGTHAPDSMVFAHPETPEGKDQKRRLDELHKHKIGLADYVYVLNVGGYVGESTRSEIEHARKLGKPIRWLDPIAALLGGPSC